MRRVDPDDTLARCLRTTHRRLPLLDHCITLMAIVSYLGTRYHCCIPSFLSLPLSLSLLPPSLSSLTLTHTF